MEPDIGLCTGEGIPKLAKVPGVALFYDQAYRQECWGAMKILEIQW